MNLECMKLYYEFAVELDGLGYEPYVFDLHYTLDAKSEAEAKAIVKRVRGHIGGRKFEGLYDWDLLIEPSDHDPTTDDGPPGPPFSVLVYPPWRSERG